MIKGLIPSYDDQIRQAWDKLSAAVFATQGEQAAYSAREGAKIAQEAIQASRRVWRCCRRLHELEAAAGRRADHRGSARVNAG